MKLPIQKTERRKEQLGSSSVEEVWPMARDLAERFLPEEIMLPLQIYQGMEPWAPKVDISENDKEFLVNIDIPGIKPEDVKLEVAGESLVIKGRTQEEKEEKGKTWHRVERRSGRFYREFELPRTADMNKIEAMMENGELMVKIPKKPEAQNRTIEIKSGAQEQGKQRGGEQGQQQ